MFDALYSAADPEEHPWPSWRRRFAARCARLLSAGAFALLASGFAAHAETRSLEDLVAAVVRVKTHHQSRWADRRQALGREREGSGVVIDEDGLVLTIGYLMVEAHSAEITTHAGRTVPATVVGYDHDTGFGVLRAIEPLKVKPLAFGRSADLKEARSGADPPRPRRH